MTSSMFTMHPAPDLLLEVEQTVSQNLRFLEVVVVVPMVVLVVPVVVVPVVVVPVVVVEVPVLCLHLPHTEDKWANTLSLYTAIMRNACHTTTRCSVGKVMFLIIECKGH